MFNTEYCSTEMQSSVNAFSSELKNIRTGRVSPDILKSIVVDSYGSKTPLTQLSNINNLDNMTLNVNIWDSSISEVSEKFKISIRGIRRKFIDEIKNLEKNKSVSIDESKKFQDEIQKLTDKSISEIELLTSSKQSEILKV